uniref:Haem-binding uptake Tiki superfamily ChaN domain-containing protein n=1 Tax=Physcomitrium patens TaxID=3218 RepID=A0A2K1JXK1_PHYPA|nr:hypothetical protein PHYPA_013376 [Physcomitrium patens]
MLKPCGQLTTHRTTLAIQELTQWQALAPGVVYSNFPWTSSRRSITLKYFQGQIVADRVMSQVIEEGMLYRGSIGKLVVITGASHVAYGSRGTGLPARVQKKLTKRTQAVVLLNPDDNWNKADHLGAVEHPSLVQPQSRNKSHQACSDSIASTLQKHNILMRSPRNQQPLS